MRSLGEGLGRVKQCCGLEARRMASVAAHGTSRGFAEWEEQAAGWRLHSTILPAVTKLGQRRHAIPGNLGTRHSRLERCNDAVEAVRLGIEIYHGYKAIGRTRHDIREFPPMRRSLVEGFGELNGVIPV